MEKRTLRGFEATTPPREVLIPWNYGRNSQVGFLTAITVHMEIDMGVVALEFDR